ncbi:MAG: heterodisulfide reductase [Deltaproteobacteria bacterium RBG_13_43_22]|nr:MAG: heterodisulfide reductase [Deltaproteobacteria bacterium RBG_13_43_22]
MEKPELECIEMNSGFINEIEEGSGIKVSACFQCRKCTNGCPVTFAMDLYPDQVMRYIQLGLKQEIRESATIWVCASCETCTTRCPNEIDIAGVMDFLKQSVVKEKGQAAEDKVLAFHQIFMDDIRKRGRVFETGLVGKYMLHSGDWVTKLKDRSILDEMLLGWTMFRKGRLNLFPKRIKGKAEIEKLFNNSL